MSRLWSAIRAIYFETNLLVCCVDSTTVDRAYQVLQYLSIVHVCVDRLIENGCHSKDAMRSTTDFLTL